MINKLIKLMSEIRPDVDFEKETALIDNGILDSFDIMSIVSEINFQFNVEINVNDLLPENFNSVKAIAELVENLQTA